MPGSSSLGKNCTRNLCNSGELRNTYNSMRKKLQPAYRGVFICLIVLQKKFEAGWLVLNKEGDCKLVW